MTVQIIDSNWVYVVSLSNKNFEISSISPIGLLENQKLYFHPIRNSFPKEPPNYIAFLYKGKLQSIHHIKNFEVFTNPHDFINEIPTDKWEPHFLYKLDKGFSPSNEVRIGNIYRNGRFWCMLDTLFTSKTIFDARDISNKRSNNK